jgi:Protein of unknown function (DUF2924)
MDDAVLITVENAHIVEPAGGNEHRRNDAGDKLAAAQRAWIPGGHGEKETWLLGNVRQRATASGATGSKSVGFEMAKSAVDVAGTLARLSELAIFECAASGDSCIGRRRRCGSPAICWSEGSPTSSRRRLFGGLSDSILRKLERLNAETETRCERKLAPPIFLKPWTRLVREWRGVTHTVLVHADGVEWNGRRYRTLTIVAREITGAHWSGPRFFGQKARRRPCRNSGGRACASLNVRSPA